MTQPTALFLADILDYGVYDAQMARVMDKAAAELRRLHAERTAADVVINDLVAKVHGLQTQNDALLEALELLVSYTESCEGLLNASPAGQVLKARAAIRARSNP